MEHKQNDRDLQLHHFLSMHYFGDDNNDQDDERDMELPFKKVEEVGTILFFHAAHAADGYLPAPQRQNLFPAKQDLPGQPSRASLFRPPIA